MPGYYVYYQDDFLDRGGIGICSFVTKKEVTEFIEERMKKVGRRGGFPDINKYLVIQGKKAELKTVQVISQMKITRVEFERAS